MKLQKIIQNNIIFKFIGCTIDTSMYYRNDKFFTIIIIAKTFAYYYYLYNFRNII